MSVQHQKRTKYLSVRTSTTERQELSIMATLAGLSTSDYTRLRLGLRPTGERHRTILFNEQMERTETHQKVDTYDKQ